MHADGELLRCEADTCVPLEIAGMCHERASGRLFICEGSGVYGGASVAAEDVVLLRLLGHGAHATGEMRRRAASVCRCHALT